LDIFCSLCGLGGAISLCILTAASATLFEDPSAARVVESRLLYPRIGESHGVAAGVVKLRLFAVISKSLRQVEFERSVIQWLKVRKSRVLYRSKDTVDTLEISALDLGECPAAAIDTLYRSSNKVTRLFELIGGSENFEAGMSRRKVLRRR
jgi:hypothetical protein